MIMLYCCDKAPEMAFTNSAFIILENDFMGLSPSLKP